MAESRRRVLVSAATIVSVGVVGCLGSDSSDRERGTLTVRVNNQSDTSEIITSTVTDPDGELREQYTDIEVPAGVSEDFESAGYESGEYRIRVQGDEWSTGSEYNPDRCLDYIALTTLEGTAENLSVASEGVCTSQPQVSKKK